ncbi:MAG: hypothetical protein WCI46_09755 [Verrucomicrobiota bacterium]
MNHFLCSPSVKAVRSLEALLVTYMEQSVDVGFIHGTVEAATG